MEPSFHARCGSTAAAAGARTGVRAGAAALLAFLLLLLPARPAWAQLGCNTGIQYTLAPSTLGCGTVNVQIVDFLTPDPGALASGPSDWFEAVTIDWWQPGPALGDVPTDNGDSASFTIHEALTFTYHADDDISATTCFGSITVLACTPYGVQCNNANFSLAPATTGCASVVEGKTDFVTLLPTTNPNTVTIAWTGLTTPPASGSSWDLSAGTAYDYTATVPYGVGSYQCTGTVRVEPCTPACNPLSFSVDGTQASSCSISVANATAGFVVASTVGPSATAVTLTDTSGTQVVPPVTYGVGTWQVVAVATYPTGTVSSPACAISVTDASPLSSGPVAKTAPAPLKRLCFYSNQSSRVPSYAVSVRDLAALPQSQACGGAGGSGGIGLYTTNCTRYHRGWARRICYPENGKSVDVLRKNAAAKETINVTIQAIDDADWPPPVPNTLPRIFVLADVYKAARFVPKKVRHLCKAITQRAD